MIPAKYMVAVPVVVTLVSFWAWWAWFKGTRYGGYHSQIVYRWGTPCGLMATYTTWFVWYAMYVCGK